MTVKPEIYPRCWCGGEVFIAEGQDEGYCFNENCYSIVRRPTSIQHKTMAPSEIKDARKALNLSANGLAEALRLGKGGGRTVRRWEAGDTPISGPATVAIELLLKQNVVPKHLGGSHKPRVPDRVPNGEPPLAKED